MSEHRNIISLSLSFHNALYCNSSVPGLQDVDQDTGEDLNPTRARHNIGGEVSEMSRNPDRYNYFIYLKEGRTQELKKGRLETFRLGGVEKFCESKHSTHVGKRGGTALFGSPWICPCIVHPSIPPSVHPSIPSVCPSHPLFPSYLSFFIFPIFISPIPSVFVYFSFPWNIILWFPDLLASL